jgi:DNA-binding GntR family transcriptional regulator
LRLDDVPARDAKVPLPGDPAQRWRMIEGLRFAGTDPKPIAWTQIYVPPAYASVTESEERDSVPIYALVEKRFGIKTRTVRQEISAVAITGDMAADLRVANGSPGLSVLRQYVSTQNEIFEVTVSVHPADRYHYTMQLDLSYAPAEGEAG